MRTALECWQDAERQVRAGDALLERREVAAAYRRYFAAMEALVGALGALPPNAEHGADLTWDWLEQVGERMGRVQRAMVTMTALYCALPHFGRMGSFGRSAVFGAAAWR